MKRLMLFVILTIMVIGCAAQTSDSVIVNYLYNNFPNTQEYIEANKLDVYKIVQADSVYSEYVRSWKAFNGVRLLEIHAGSNIIAICGLPNKEGGVLSDTYNEDAYFFIGPNIRGSIPAHYDRVLRRLEQQ